MYRRERLSNTVKYWYEIALEMIKDEETINDIECLCIFFALERIGDKTSGSILLSEAKKHDYYGNDTNHYEPITLEQCYRYRRYWREFKKLEGRDCRTYATQPRRSMLPDNKIEPEKLRALSRQLKGKNTKRFGELLSQFHSIDQLRNAVDHIREARKARKQLV